MTSDPTLLRGRAVAFLCALGCAFFPSSASAQAQEGEPPPSPAPLPLPAPPDLRVAVARVKPAFVRLYVEQRRRERAGAEAPEPGFLALSGTLMNEQGYVLTVGDALEGAEAIVAENEGGEIVLADFIACDEVTNVGVVRVADLGAQPAEFAQEESVQAGLPIFALGNPFALGITVTPGHVSGVGRTIELRGREWSNLLQLALDANPGDQGGPIADAEGRVVGMLVTRLWHAPEEAEDVEPHGIAFALPIGEALRAAEAGIRAHREEAGRVPVPWIGVRVQSIKSEALAAQLCLKPDEGLLVERVFKSSPAEQAGLRPNDVLLRFGGRSIGGLDLFGQLIREAGAGATITLEVIRGGERVELVVEIGTRG